MGKRRWERWTRHEDELIWSHPDWTARELREVLPHHSEGAIRMRRARIGRYRPRFAPLCQRCNDHPVWTASADGRRWGLCRRCTLDEREWRVRHRGELDVRDNAIRQARFKDRRRRERRE